MGFFSKIFGGGKKESSSSSIASTPSVPSFESSKLGKTLSDELIRRIGGQGVGFDPRFVGRTSSPVIAQREARFREFERPQLEAATSGRGIGRSTITLDLLRRQGAQKERDISNILGQAFGAQEAQKRAEISEALGLAPGVTGQELRQGTIGAQLAQQRALAEAQLGQQRDIAGRQSRSGLLSSLIGAGGAVGAGIFGRPVASTLGLLGGGTQQQQDFGALFPQGRPTLSSLLLR